MKTFTFESTNEIFKGYTLLNDEMITVRGGEGGDPIVKPSPPPVAI